MANQPSNTKSPEERVVPSDLGFEYPPTDSEKKILRAIVKAGSISQPDLVRNTQLAQQSVSRLVKGLIERGAIGSTRMASGRRGQPSVAVHIEAGFAYTFGVELMTDSFSVALMNFNCQVIDEVHYNQPSMSRNLVIPKLKDVFRLFISKHKLDSKRIFGIGVGISGYCLGGHGRYNTPKALDDWALIDLEDLLSEELGYPVWVENDANAAAIGESLAGAGRTYDNFVYLYIASGIGGGIIINGELHRGCYGNGGEVGLILPSQFYVPPTLDLLRVLACKHGQQLGNVSEMLEKFDVNWPAVDEWINQTQDSFSLIASSLSAILDTEAIVLGGRIPTPLAQKLIPHIDIYDDARRSSPRQMPRILCSESTDIGSTGAAAIPLKKYFFSEL